ncbi:MAG: phosphatase PAP2 family protein [Anaerolineae bacterium]
MDAALFALINGWAGRSVLLDAAGRILGSDFFAPSILTLILVAMWFEEESAGSGFRRLAFRVVVAVLLANVIVAVLNLVYPRPRPFSTLPAQVLTYRPSDPSFPSNAAAVAAVFPAVIWARSPRLAWPMGLLAFIFSFARVFVGVHYPLDIVTGWLVGWSSARLAWRLDRRLHPLFDGLSEAAERLGLV